MTHPKLFAIIAKPFDMTLFFEKPQIFQNIDWYTTQDFGQYDGFFAPLWKA